MKKNSSTIIRPASFADAPLIFDLIRKFPNELLARPLGDIVQNIDRILVGEVGGTLAGTISWQILPEIGAPRNPSIELKSLAVDKSFQRRGLGRALVKAAIRRVRTFHPAQIVVLTFCPLFFAKLGFREVPKQTLMHKLYMGCVNCTKYDSPFSCPEIAMALRLKS
ncbi:MAG: GNAT family N-acetyltransferase [Kiritimatiellae bacterium]|nr:GNAT family N-acetyltransferase [Kiritimatiellia bacterium]